MLSLFLGLLLLYAIVLCFLLFCAAFCSILVVGDSLQCLARFVWLVETKSAKELVITWCGVFAEFASELVKG